MRNKSPICRAAVLVPLYKESLSEIEQFSFELTLHILGKYDIYVICPNRLINYVNLLSRKYDMRFQIKVFDNKNFSSIYSYNRLMTSISFYNAFIDYEYVLIVQTDALVLSDQIEYWCDIGYSYIGAPWFNKSKDGLEDYTFLGVGNGGFSLRKVKSFIDVLSVKRYIPNTKNNTNNISPYINFFKYVINNYILAFNFKPLFPYINEDYFWGLLVPQKCKSFTVPLPEVGLSFAFEVHPRYLFDLNENKLPFGCHAWHKYDYEFWESTLKLNGINLPHHLEKSK